MLNVEVLDDKGKSARGKATRSHSHLTRCQVLVFLASNRHTPHPSGTEVAAFAHVAQEMLGDVQERLALRAADIYVDK